MTRAAARPRGTLHFWQDGVAFVGTDVVNDPHRHFTASLAFTLSRPFRARFDEERWRAMHGMLVAPNARQQMDARGCRVVIFQIDPESGAYAQVGGLFAQRGRVVELPASLVARLRAGAEALLARVDFQAAALWSFVLGEVQGGAQPPRCPCARAAQTRAAAPHGRRDARRRRWPFAEPLRPRVQRAGRDVAAPLCALAAAAARRVLPRGGPEPHRGELRRRLRRLRAPLPNLPLHVRASALRALPQPRREGRGDSPDRAAVGTPRSRGSGALGRRRRGAGPAEVVASRRVIVISQPFRSSESPKPGGSDAPETRGCSVPQHSIRKGGSAWSHAGRMGDEGPGCSRW